ncbi:adenosylcobalamin-dependent ribonucleoside-diphosphate reductase [Candidatus Collierbacteria bacterium]|nr:adenosylcobalamin-dependent ribonucleoside-diphosphate reductase [Candidatus Collierbacteria bacterium]
MTNLSDNALVVLKKRGYLLPKEIPDQMFRRVANLIASADKKYLRVKGDKADQEIKKVADDFYRAMSNLEYLSGSVLLNAGRKHKQFSACYVLPLSDSLEDIYDQLRNAALILRTGGGIGIPLTNLRPRGSLVESTGGISSGAVSFLRLFNYSAATIAEASARRPALMGVLKVDHPDIVEFIMSKEDPSTLYHFNVSVGATDEFMEKVKAKKGTIHLFHPNDGATEKDIDVMELWNLIATQAWKVGDPGLVFLDVMNKYCPTPKLGIYQATNPCGEQALLPYESCNLGNINLGRFVSSENSEYSESRNIRKSESQKAGSSDSPILRYSDFSGSQSFPSVLERINWKRLEEVVRLGVHFQDNVIDLCDYPIPQLKKMALTTRKIGVGVMGWADMLIKLGVRYDSEAALKLAKKTAKFIHDTARDASVELARSRGSFPAFEDSVWQKQGFTHMRNSTVNTVAPTGTISIIAGCSSGIEPLFALAYRRENILDLGKTSLLEVNEEFSKAVGVISENSENSESRKIRKSDNQTTRNSGSLKLRSSDLSDVPSFPSVLERVSVSGSCQNIKEIPQEVRDIFRVSMEIPYRWHIKMQAAWQKYTDAAVSKTINLPNSATVDDIKNAYLLAFETGCKGITVYRDGCRREQVLNVGKVKGQRLTVKGNPDEVCPECRGELTLMDGCATCQECGWSKCSV